MERQRISPHTFLDAKGATGAGTELLVQDYQHIVVSIATDGGGDAALTVKCQGAVGSGVANTPPTWASAQSVSNHWTYIALYDYISGSLTAGGTGFVVATADDYKHYLVNVDGIDWINFNVTARTAGEVTVIGVAYNNQ
jgi:hypothetical protein